MLPRQARSTESAPALEFVSNSSATGSLSRRSRYVAPLLPAEPQTLRPFGVDADLVLHERVHFTGADADELEAALVGEGLHLGIAVEGCPEIREPLSRLGRRALRHADATIGAVDPVDAQFAK